MLTLSVEIIFHSYLIPWKLGRNMPISENYFALVCKSEKYSLSFSTPLLNGEFGMQKWKWKCSLLISSSAFLITVHPLTSAIQKPSLERKRESHRNLGPHTDNLPHLHERKHSTFAYMHARLITTAPCQN